MNPEINTRISRDWFDMKKALTSGDPPLELLHLETTCFPEAVRLLDGYAEKGLVDAKMIELNGLFTFIGEMGFRGVARKDFPPVLSRAAILVLITWAERAILEGLISTGSDRKEQDEGPEPTLKEIIAEINVYGRNNPALLRSGGHISKALKLLKVLQEEQKKTKQILAYPENNERQQTILSNFRQRYTEMEAGILEAYKSFRSELAEKTASGEPKSPLGMIDRTALSRTILHQIRSLLEVFSALSFAAAQSTGLKDVHRHLMLRQTEIKDTLGKEQSHILRLLKEAMGDGGTEAAVPLQNELRFSVIEWLRLHIPEKPEA